MKFPALFFSRPNLWLLGGLLAGRVAAADMAQTFASPQEAVAALTAAVSTEDSAALHNIFGPEAADLVNPDAVQARLELDRFSAALAEEKRLVPDSPTRQVLEVGTDHFPFSVPLVEQDGRWHFDAAAGKEELLNRRIGRNELHALGVMRTYVEAQREYASRDRDNDEVLEYAQKFFSSPGQRDGLYWPPDLDGELSPLGPQVAAAQAEGYGKNSKSGGEPEPFHGYFYKILTRQGRHAPGGRYDDVINGNMIAGFGLVAYPAVYGESGVMTFIVNQQGKVYQKDLGPKTAQMASAMTEYDPDPSWAISPD